MEVPSNKVHLARTLDTAAQLISAEQVKKSKELSESYVDDSKRTQIIQGDTNGRKSASDKVKTVTVKDGMKMIDKVETGKVFPSKANKKQLTKDHQEKKGIKASYGQPRSLPIIRAEAILGYYRGSFQSATRLYRKMYKTLLKEYRKVKRNCRRRFRGF